MAKGGDGGGRDRRVGLDGIRAHEQLRRRCEDADEQVFRVKVEDPTTLASFSERSGKFAQPVERDVHGVEFDRKDKKAFETTCTIAPADGEGPSSSWQVPDQRLHCGAAAALGLLDCLSSRTRAPWPGHPGRRHDLAWRFAGPAQPKRILWLRSGSDLGQPQFH